MNTVNDVSELIAQNIEDRSERIVAVQAWLDGQPKKPDPDELERLADYILREELTDPNPYKIAHNEYPFMSTWQLDLRRDREYADHLADSYDSTGRNHSKPERRRRTAKENRFVDRAARLKNRKRNAQYRKDTAPGPVISTKSVPSESFTECRGSADKWRSFIDRHYVE